MTGEDDDGGGGDDRDNDLATVIPKLESGVLGIVLFWYNKYPHKKVLELIEKSFCQEQIRGAELLMSGKVIWQATASNVL